MNTFNYVNIFTKADQERELNEKIKSKEDRAAQRKINRDIREKIMKQPGFHFHKSTDNENEFH